MSKRGAAPGQSDAEHGPGARSAAAGREPERPGSGRRHTGRRRNEAARDAILDATLDMLRTEGLQNVTIDAIAHAAGVGRQTIYRWWPSKGAMLAEAMGQRARAVVPPPGSGSFDADLMEFITASFRGLEDPGTARGLRDLASAAQHDEHVAQALGDFTAQRRGVFRALLERGRDEGRLSASANLDTLADLFYGFLWYRLLLGHAPLDANAARDLTAHLIAAGSPTPPPHG